MLVRRAWGEHMGCCWCWLPRAQEQEQELHYFNGIIVAIVITYKIEAPASKGSLGSIFSILILSRYVLKVSFEKYCNSILAANQDVYNLFNKFSFT